MQLVVMHLGVVELVMMRWRWWLLLCLANGHITVIRRSWPDDNGSVGIVLGMMRMSGGIVVVQLILVHCRWLFDIFGQTMHRRIDDCGIGIVRLITAVHLSRSIYRCSGMFSCSGDESVGTSIVLLLVAGLLLLWQRH